MTNTTIKLRLRIGRYREQSMSLIIRANNLQDKFIVVESMSVDGIWIKRWMLESRIFESALGKTNYFSQNGIAKFQIPYSDTMRFWLDTVTVDD